MSIDAATATDVDIETGDAGDGRPLLLLTFYGRRGEEKIKIDTIAMPFEGAEKLALSILDRIAERRVTCLVDECLNTTLDPKGGGWYWCESMEHWFCPEHGEVGSGEDAISVEEDDLQNAELELDLRRRGGEKPH
jgi:hypothetical protein